MASATKRRTMEFFAAEHGMTLEAVRTLYRLHKRAGILGERICNGEPHHPANTTGTKERNCELWRIEQDALDKQIMLLIQPHGFEGLEYNGLYPTLKKNGRDVHITD